MTAGPEKPEAIAAAPREQPPAAEPRAAGEAVGTAKVPNLPCEASKAEPAPPVDVEFRFVRTLDELPPISDEAEGGAARGVLERGGSLFVSGGRVISAFLFSKSLFHNFSRTSTPGSLEGINALKHVSTIQVNASEMTDDDMSVFGGLPKLEWLDMTGGTAESPIEVTSVGLSLLANTRNLTTLTMKYSRVDDISGLAALPKLQRLYLSGAPITDEGLSSLPRFAALESLGIDDSAVSSKALEHVKGARKLRVLGVRGVKLSAVSVTLLRTARPELDVRQSFGDQLLRTP